MTTTGATPHDVRPPTPAVVPTTNGTERRKQRGVVLRVLVYVVLAHGLAAYLYFLFTIAGKH
ncbi:DUF6126 family protein [Streptomyces sp. NPDC021020]|uniref:DUF6126 family protein n=1 Tax=Streptomyces sp. NPDC021020 TaxID=3365109 RepID=UPI0037AC8785